LKNQQAYGIIEKTIIIVNSGHLFIWELDGARRHIDLHCITKYEECRSMDLTSFWKYSSLTYSRQNLRACCLTVMGHTLKDV